MNLNELRDRAHKTSKDKGWYDNGQPPALERHMLMVSEVAEATEEVRKGTPAVYGIIPDPDGNRSSREDDISQGVEKVREMALKPEGEAIELADVMIRIADYFGAKGWDLDAIVKLKLDYNETRPHRHGGKRH